MTWRFRIIRIKPDDYGLHSVHLDKAGKPDAYVSSPVTFNFNENQGYFGNDTDARQHMVSLLTQALDDATQAPILELDDKGGLIEADPI
jgi:hypothetical protein